MELKDERQATEDSDDVTLEECERRAMQFHIETLKDELRHSRNREDALQREYTRMVDGLAKKRRWW